MKRTFLWLAISVAVIVVIGKVFFSPHGIDALPDSQIELTKVVDEVTFKLTDKGELYRVDDSTGKWHYHDTVFDPEGMLASYRTEGDVVYRLNPETNESAATITHLREGFEDLPVGVDGTRKMIGIERGWGALTLQSPATPEVSEYVALRTKIINEGASFIDASIAPDDSKFRSGTQSLKCVAPPRPSNMICCKSSISSPLVYFRQDDDFWFRGYFFAESARPYSILDLECEWIKQHAGIRIIIDENGLLGVELKALDKPKYLQLRRAADEVTPYDGLPSPSKVATDKNVRRTSSRFSSAARLSDNPIVFPLGQWVEVKAHFLLSHHDDGVIQLWQDGQLIVDTHGVTLPLKRVIYSSLEIGISAHSYGDKPCELWVDDLEVSSQPIAD